MKQDIKEMIKGYSPQKVELSENHEQKFKDLLRSELHQRKVVKLPVRWLSIAAAIALVITIAVQLNVFNTKRIEPPKEQESKQISLGSISPEFQTIETYYTNSIRLELSEIEMTDENKIMVDSYLAKVGELTKEYKSLTLELNTKGVNDATIDALIRNLQLRLQLLQRLRKQLKEVKQLNTNQNESQII